MNRWPHQLSGVEDVLAALKEHQRVLLTSPTGGGKTLMMRDLIEQWVRDGLRVALFTNRKLLIEQTSRMFEDMGIDHGVRAVGWAEEHLKDVQICSVQSERARRDVWNPHNSDVILLDEAHMHTSPKMEALLADHVENGGRYVGVTATPIGLGALYDHLVVAGCPSELRRCGALVPALHYGPDEPDIEHLAEPDKRDPNAELTVEERKTAIMRPGLFGRVLKWFNIVNPERKPTILFAPGVAESLWFAEQFEAAGISAAHIDGQDVWRGGNFERSSREARQELLRDSERGRVNVLCTRFVLREGVDCPWLAHGIFATIFGSLQSYLQSGGRLLRSHPSLAHITIQDHGGNWWRWGSLNADRHWRLDCADNVIRGLRAERLRSKKCQRCHSALRPHFPVCSECGFLNEAEGWRCPECARVCQGDSCTCGYCAGGRKRSRPVVQTDGSLIEVEGDIFKPRRVFKRPDGPQRWERMYHRSCTQKGSRTFSAAMALFAMENYWQWPDRSWPLMPTNDLDLFRKVGDVPRERLIP